MITGVKLIILSSLILIMLPALQPEKLPSFDLPQSHLIPVDQLPKQRRPYGSKGVASGAGGRVVTPAGVFSHIIDLDGLSGSVGHQTLGEESDEMQGIEMEGPAMSYVDVNEPEISPQAPAIDASLKRADKKQRQWRKWSEDIIPALLEPYLTLMRETELLRNIGMVRSQKGCTGCINGRTLDVSCIYFNSECSII